MRLLKNLTFVDSICVFRTKDAGDDKINLGFLFKGGDKDLEMLKKKYPKVDVVLSEKYKSISSSSIIDRINNS